MENSEIFQLLDEIGAKLTEAGVVDKAETTLAIGEVPLGETYEYGGITDAKGVHLYFRPSTASEYVQIETASSVFVITQEIFTVRAVITAEANAPLLQKNILLKEYLLANLSAAFLQKYSKHIEARVLQAETAAEIIFDEETTEELPGNPSFAIAAIEFKLAFTPTTSQCFTPKCNFLRQC